MIAVTDETDLIELVRQDGWMMDVLTSARTLNLPDWWVCAGFVRSKIWDTLHGFAHRTPLPDVDVVYLDRRNLDEAEEKRHEAVLRSLRPDIPWSVKNEARMHVLNDLAPYSSAFDAISKFPETSTSLGLSLDDNDRLILAAPHGLADLLRPAIRPTPQFREMKRLAAVYEERIRTKRWKDSWPLLEVEHLSLG